MTTPKNPHAQSLGALGGHARAAKLTPARRKAISQHAALASAKARADRKEKQP